MQGVFQTIRFWHNNIHIKNQGYSSRGKTLEHIKGFSFRPSQSCPTKHGEVINDAQSDSLPEKGLQNTTVAQVLLTKGDEKVGSWLWCRTDDSVYDAVKQVSLFTFQSKRVKKHKTLPCLIKYA